MPNATVRANAQALPDAHHEELRLQGADARADEAERETATSFARAYSAWLAGKGWNSRSFGHG